MNIIIIILVALGLVYGCSQFLGYYGKVKQDAGEAPAKSVVPTGLVLPDLPTPQLEQSLQQATASGPEAMKNWIEKYGSLAPEPRRSAIELDYIQLASRSNPAEAKRRFNEVRARIASDSPLAERVKKMEKVF